MVSVAAIFDQVLTVDAENWIVQKCKSSVMLNICSSCKTATDFVILSGDMDYLFAYNITFKI